MFLPILSQEKIREWEQKSWSQGIQPDAVIQAVGREMEICTRTTRLRFGHVIILAGKGNNGADAVAFEKCLPLGESRSMLQVLDPVQTAADFRGLLRNHRDEKILVIDGLFGIGLNRVLDPGYVALIQAINDADAYKIAIDVPSGLDARGMPFPVAVEADETLTVGAMKDSFLQKEAADYIGKVSVLRNVGLAEWVDGGEMQWSDWAGESMPRRKANGHKGTFGHLFIVAGSPGYHGAAVLCARGAMRAQPGLITVLTAPETYLPVASQLQAPMVRGWRNSEFVLPEKTTAVVAGPGLAFEELPVQIKRAVQDIWTRFEGAMVADASALAWLPESTRVMGPRVMTPHPGEAARMLGQTIEEIQADRKGAVRKLSGKFGNCWVILKGHQTLIGRAEGRILVNGSGNASLAQGGTGDILAGYLGGLLAQKALRADMERTICFGVWKHGNGGDLAREKNGAWITEELPDWL